MRKKKRKLKAKKGFWIFLAIILIVFFSYVLVKEYIGFEIKNIHVYDNKLLKESEIIKQAGLENNSNFYTTSIYSIKNKLKKLDYVKEVKVKKRFFQQVDIYITEYEVLFLNNEDNMFVLENGKKVTNNLDFVDVPILINYVPDQKFETLVTKFLKIDTTIRSKISEIKYDPNEFDEDRFLLYMNDKNYVYITLTKLDLLNKYNDAIEQFEGKKGILYLDSGNYFKIMK